MAKKPKAVAAEGAPLVAEVAKGTSATNVAEEEWKMSSLPKYVAVPTEHPPVHLASQLVLQTRLGPSLNVAWSASLKA